jgi:4-amino-4-deoxy-L-arabinose transferase-like glycosyltransferase
LKPGRAFALLACYFVLQTLFRTLVSNSAELDESEQLLWTQSWQWGYGSDPPLYTWLQIIVFNIFGTSILGLALLKNLLLFCGFIFTYFAAREGVQDERLAMIATLSLLICPDITWESQRDLTHSVLATALAAATFLLAAHILREQKPLDYLLLGICVGLGALSKYSYCLVAFALGVGALTTPAFRRAALSKWMLLTFAAFLALTALHFRWALTSSELALSRPEELVRSSTGSPVRTRLLGLFSVAKCCVTISGALALGYLVAFRSFKVVRPIGEARIFLQWVARTLLVIGVICVLVVLAVGIELRNRWFQPIVFLLAITAAALFRDQFDPPAQRRFACLSAAVAVITLLLLPAIPLSASVTKRPTRLNAPYSALLPALKNRTSNPGVIVAANRLVGGNLRLLFPESTVVAPEFHQLQLPQDRPWLIAWDASKSVDPPPALGALVRQLRGADLAALRPEYVEAPYKYTQARSMRLGYLRLPAAGTAGSLLP